MPMPLNEVPPDEHEAREAIVETDKSVLPFVVAIVILVIALSLGKTLMSPEDNGSTNVDSQQVEEQK